MSSLSQNMLIPQSELQTAVDILRSGGVVAFPTETVYGLGADATNPQAIAELYRVKNRPANRPLTVHLADIDEIGQWVDAIPPAAQKLIDHFCPGPLTLVLPRRAHVLDIVTAGGDSVGIRLPSHPMARQLIRAFGTGLVAPSANRSGYLSPTSAEHVRQELGDSVPLVIDGGPCQMGIESTIIDFSGATPRLLREGLLTLDILQETAGAYIEPAAERSAASAGQHYTPHTPAIACPSDRIAKTARQMSAEHSAPLAVVFYSASLNLPASPSVRPVQLPAEPLGYAKRLYSALRYLDGCCLNCILIEELPDAKEWDVLSQRIKQITKR